MPRVCLCKAVEGRLETLPSGGECISKRYMEFSHLCTVRDYLPTVDYCCCAHHQLVLCCRYHQNWNHFRCNDADDVLMMTYVRAYNKHAQTFFMAALCNRAGHIYFHVVSSSSFFPRQISAVGDLMSTILPRMVSP